MTIKFYYFTRKTAGRSLGNVSLGTGSIDQPLSEIFPRLGQLIVYTTRWDIAFVYFCSARL
jgi:hypothetical protein